MDAEKRRQYVLETLKQQSGPLSASVLAKECQVSRQLIVGDIALLRASGNRIIATPRGYIMDVKNDHEWDYTIAVVHKKEELKDELTTIVAQGGSILNVTVEHPLYGELCGNLHIYSQYDIERFIEQCHSTNATPLSTLTEGVHLHTIRVREHDAYERILHALDEKGYLYHKES